MSRDVVPEPDRSAPDPPAAPPRTPPDQSGFVLAPFRGLRFDPDLVGDLGTVISPPYDVLDADTVRDLEAANRRNIVRLILSRRFEKPYRAVRERLEQWRAAGFLRPDDVPALYCYEYVVDRVVVRGLVGVVGLREESLGVVLPHEEVMPGPVDDRSVLMRTTETNLEPILLVHDGTARLRALVDDAVRALDPVADFVALDGSRHRLWAVSDSEVLTGIATEVAGSRALIADGHHRYAAYRRLQQQLREPSAPAGTSPWDFGLALLVDQADHPLHIGPIHRSVSALTMSDLQELCVEHGDELETAPDRESAFARRRVRAEAAGGSQGRGSAAFVVSDGRAWAVVSTPRSNPVDAAVLHERLLPAWGVSEDQVGYHHSLDQALQTTVGQPGLVVAVEPPSVDAVMQTAAEGVRMPRKSTSFAPKPRMGVVMRDLRDA